MATREQMGNSLAPGSIPYGDRGSLEANLPTGPNPNVPTGAVGGGGLPSSVPYNFDPLDAVGQGIVPPKGRGRMAPAAPTGPTTRQQRLAAIAREANSPALRHVARSLMVRDARRGA